MSHPSIPTDKVIQDIRVLIRDSEEMLAATADVAGERIKELRVRLSHALGEARESCRGLEDQAVEKVKEADEVIRRHPYESIGIALGFGVLLGLAIGRSR